eukprot:gnl/MRDRNA2_/MRDRNA2_121120_c0_seq1.p1 gnl/MRDRNA2_/MRDRNA2_121120_c0~~gnl/MRDRNA2_/MRDRNA2_121120_c0_seq1.p1  ORF type:complete len:301 (+),score=56.86 gnl/MRDRNA2_/MRDRNA2_121120_c0_seq1:111-1013(+)
MSVPVNCFNSHAERQSSIRLIPNLHVAYKSKDEALDDATSVGETTDSDLSFSISDDDSPKTSFPSPSRFSPSVANPKSDNIEERREGVQELDEERRMCSTSSQEGASCHDACCEKEALNFWWCTDNINSSNMGAIEMVSLGPVTIELSSNLQICIQTGSPTNPTFVRANCISIQQDGTALVKSPVNHAAKDAISVEGKLEDLIVDVKVAHDDEPKMISVLGAQLKKGSVVRIFARSSTGEINCIVRCNRYYEVVALTNVVLEMREVEVLRRDARLLLYQKQLNSMMVGNLRRRWLGLDCS